VLAEADASGVTRADVERAAAAFIGEIEQVPPMMSAVKVGGERLYRKARRGEEIEREPRRVTVHAFDLEGFTPGARAGARVRVRCSRGTYVRTLAHDLGRALGVGGHIGSLRRTGVARFREGDAVSLDEVDASALRPLLDAVSGYPRREVDADGARDVAHGKATPAFGVAGEYAVVGPQGLVAMAEDRGTVSRPVVVVTDP